MVKVLVIEDDTFLGEVLLRELQSAGYETKLVRDGADALERMREWKPEVVLLDILLPHKNGYEILEDKAQDPSVARIPTIIISNSGQPIEINRALALGVKDYIVKAEFDPEEVLEKVRVQLGGAAPGAVAELEKETASPSRTGGVVLAGKTVLSVEDDAFLSDIIARKLTTEGCSFLHARDGKVALDIAEKESPDVILLDILLPGMDGYEVLRRLKENPKTANIPVFLFSNLGQQSDIEKGKRLGAARFFVKAAVTLDEVVEAITKLM